MKVLICLSNTGGELVSVVIDAHSEDDPAIAKAVLDIANGGIQVGDTLTVSEVQGS